MNIENIKLGFKVAALWSSTDFDDEPLDSNYTIFDISIKAHATLNAYVENFIASNQDDVELALEIMDDEQFGHSLWLSSNGHGAGFFDFKGECFKRLQVAARGNEMDIYVGDDNKLYL